MFLYKYICHFKLAILNYVRIILVYHRESDMKSLNKDCC